MLAARSRSTLDTCRRLLSSAESSPVRRLAGRNVAEELARIAILSLNFSSIMKTPAHPDDPKRTLDFMDFPDMIAKRYDVHWIEPYSTHFLSTETPYLKEFLGRVKKANSRINQISVGGLSLNMSAPDPVQRLEAIDVTKRWIDHCAELECPPFK